MRDNVAEALATPEEMPTNGQISHIPTQSPSNRQISQINKRHDCDGSISFCS